MFIVRELERKGEREAEMSERLTLDYYYGIEAEQFSFYRVPKLLIRDARFKSLSSDAKLLYGLMLDRMALSIKNGWLDEQNRAYIIYSLDDVMEELGSSKPTCIKVIRELDSENGIGLIEKVRRGLGKPDIIYVKNFATISDKTDQDGDEKDFTSRSKESLPPEVKNLYFKKSNNFTSRSKENELQEVKEFDPNYTNMNQTEMNENDVSETDLINPINHQENMPQEGDWQTREIDDQMDDGLTCMKKIRENIEYDFQMQHGDYQTKKFYTEIYRVIQDALVPKRKTIKLGGVDYPYELVKDRFMELDSGHIDYVKNCLKESTTKKYNIKGYLLMSLYSAPTTIDQYYQQEVQHDLHGGGLDA